MLSIWATVDSLWLEMDAPFSSPLFNNMTSISHISWRVEMELIYPALVR